MNNDEYVIKYKKYKTSCTQIPDGSPYEYRHRCGPSIEFVFNIECTKKLIHKGGADR